MQVSYTSAQICHETSRCPIARPSAATLIAATLIIDAHVPHRRRNGSSAIPISRAICAANERGFDMKIDPRGSRADHAQDPGPSIDTFEDEEAIRQLVADAHAILRSRVANVPSD